MEGGIVPAHCVCFLHCLNSAFVCMLLAQAQYRVLARMYQCFEVRYSSSIGQEETEKFCFPAINLEKLSKHYVFDAHQATPSGQSSSSSSEEEKESEAPVANEDVEESSDDEVVVLPKRKARYEEKARNAIKTQKGGKAGKEVKVKKETEKSTNWATHCSHSSKVRACH